MNQRQGPKFLISLFEILEGEENINVIRWNNEGDAFEIVNADLLVNSILSVHYKQSNFFSFVRQLNQYGFNKQKIDKNSYSFRHKYFLKDQKKLIAKIVSSHKQKVLEFKREQRENVFNDDEQNVQTKTIQELQQNQHKIFSQFKEQMNTQMQIKQLIIYLKNKIAEFNIQIEQQCFIAQTLLIKVIKTIPNDEQYQCETELLKNVLQEFSNIYLEYYGYNQSQRSPNLSILSLTPAPFQMNEQQRRSLGLVDTNKVHINEQIQQYLRWVKESYERAIIRNAI
ncbi:unnamed protein product (macronuclear) [Paramecium tetraurelia]|uniref:HSF-type DNA-binding domain-containing protein n=1 Tax=Paramecium tetraurelia TaxID=5888 RepID=A0D644_PARTE|nr:uncharacterized protein GSPATT00013941001 [Paramecium tetraurelia]CAK78511.1 unnamed protein product [Paramecium tetraurelia]|eukprot:XP_001445908.1 hypothetical protein (macronuclear) [Paramecium tetraurelia strain d4-2]